MLKQDKELVKLHKRCCKTYLVQRSVKHSKIKKFFIVYEFYIGPKNIRNFFFRPIHIFVQAIILDQLGQIEDYINKVKPEKKKRRRTKKE